MNLKTILVTSLLVFSLHLVYAQIDVNIQLVQFATGFDKPVEIVNAGDDRLFILEKEGLVRILNADGSTEEAPFLDIQGLTSTGGVNSEQGLLGMAFHPQYTDNGYFFLNYTRPNGDTRISRFTVTSDPDVADAASIMNVITIDQPYGNHNGGCIRFGQDGYLYVGMGDGGSGEDPLNSGQTMSSLLGKILRLDVDGAEPYDIPASNPFVGTSNDTLPEIWASGIRNPWKFSFDSQTGDMYIGDVGQYSWEEIDFQAADSPGGENYGWRCYEGNHSGFGGGCPPMSSFTGAVAEFSHSAGHCSVTGGVVYRGEEYPMLYGKYFYADYCSGQFWSLEQNDADEWVDFMVTGTLGFGWTAIGEANDGEVYVSNQSSGVIWQITDPCQGEMVEVTQSGNTFTAQSANSYQWYLNGTVIDEATTQSYEFDENGAYSVLIETSGGCYVFSETFDVTLSSLEDLTNVHGIWISNNPVNEVLSLKFSSELTDDAQLRVFDSMGREVDQAKVNSGLVEWSENVTDFAAGNYTINLSNSTGVSSVRFTVLR